MSDAPVTAADLVAFVRDTLHANRDAAFDEWVEANAFDPDGLAKTVNFLHACWLESRESQQVAILMGFTLGWDAHRHFRGERE